MSRTERSGRYGSIIDRDDRDERESRSRRRDSDYKRSSDDRRGDRYDDYRDYDSPEVSDSDCRLKFIKLYGQSSCKETWQLEK